LKLIIIVDTTSSLQEGLTDENNEKDDDEEEDTEIEFKISEPDVTHPTVAPRFVFSLIYKYLNVIA